MPAKFSLIVAAFAACTLTAAALAQPPESPAEIQKTQELNEHNATDATHAYQQSQQQQAQFKQQMDQYRAAQARYKQQVRRYKAERKSYEANRARYHRGDWPTHFEYLFVAPQDELLNAEVKTYDGRYVGHVDQLARGPSGDVDSARVALRDGHGKVWVDKGDLRYDAVENTVMTDLNLDDLTQMAKR